MRAGGVKFSNRPIRMDFRNRRAPEIAGTAKQIAAMVTSAPLAAKQLYELVYQVLQPLLSAGRRIRIDVVFRNVLETITQSAFQ